MCHIAIVKWQVVLISRCRQAVASRLPNNSVQSNSQPVMAVAGAAHQQQPPVSLPPSCILRFSKLEIQLVENKEDSHIWFSSPHHHHKKSSNPVLLLPIRKSFFSSLLCFICLRTMVALLYFDTTL